MEDIARPVDDREAARSRGPRRFVALVVAGGAALSVAMVAAGLVVAFHVGGSSDSSQSVSSTNSAQAQAVAFVDCLRRNGVPKFPDPGSDGAILLSPNDGIDVNGQAYKKAESACKSLAPSGQRMAPAGGQSGPDLTEYVTCMRKNGLPKFPYPNAQGMFTGIDLGTPEYKAAQNACAKFLPSGAPSPAAY